jgi:hypothetical protein
MFCPILHSFSSVEYYNLTDDPETMPLLAVLGYQEKKTDQLSYKYIQSITAYQEAAGIYGVSINYNICEIEMNPRREIAWVVGNSRKASGVSFERGGVEVRWRVF